MQVVARADFDFEVQGQRCQSLSIMRSGGKILIVAMSALSGAAAVDPLFLTSKQIGPVASQFPILTMSGCFLLLTSVKVNKISKEWLGVYGNRKSDLRFILDLFRALNLSIPSAFAAGIFSKWMTDDWKERCFTLFSTPELRDFSRCYQDQKESFLCKDAFKSNPECMGSYPEDGERKQLCDAILEEYFHRHEKRICQGDLDEAMHVLPTFERYLTDQAMDEVNLLLDSHPEREASDSVQIFFFLFFIVTLIRTSSAVLQYFIPKREEKGTLKTV